MLHRTLKHQQRLETEGDPLGNKRQLEGSGDEAGPRKPPKKLARRAASAHSRQKTSSALRVRESALFRPVRAIGVVTDSLPISVQTLGDASFVTTSVGRGFQVFEGEKLRLAYIGPRLNEKIRALINVGETTITSLKSDIVVWHKLTEIGRFRGHRGSATVLCVIGAGFLVSAAGADVLVWQLSDIGLEDAASASTEQGLRKGSCVLAPLGRLILGEGFGSVTTARHPATYLHKVLLGGSSGGIELWNVRSRELVHAFRSHLPISGESCAVTSMLEAPNALDIVAVGFASGRICMMNVREDKVLFEFQQAQGRVTCLAFRSGPNALPHLVSGAPTGDLVVWDLEKRRAHHVQEAAHRGAISSVHFIPEEPLMLTSGRDNAVRMWIFDTADGLPRLLKGRGGCPGPARRLSFYGNDGDKELLVGGGFEGTGYLSKISFIQDHQNNEYSQSAFQKMSSALKTGAGQVKSSHLPPVVDVAYCQVRHFDWPAVVTAHDGMEAAMVWSASHQALAPLALRPPPESNGGSPVSAVAISACGSYCVLGLENGALHRFNLQSGLYRGSIPKLPDKAEDPATAGERGPKKAFNAKAPPTAPRAHLGRVCGLSITVSGQVVSTASHPKDCSLSLWRLTSHEAAGTLPLGKGRPGQPSCLLMRSLGALVAVSLDDGMLRVADLNGMSVVRSFACGVPATDIAFTPDGRWLAAALCDGGLRIFDLPAARCIDSFVFAQPALSLCFSPSTAFLLTTHAKGNSIQVWANKFLFDPSLSAPLLRPEPEAPVHVDEPGAPDFESEDEAEEGEAAADSSKTPAVSSAVPLGPDLVTLSDVPPAKVLATLYLDLVKERNKAIAPPKPLPNAPFFLPISHDGVTPKFVAPLAEAPKAADSLAASTARPSLFDEMVAAEKSDQKSHTGITDGLPFQLLLRKGEFDKALDFLKAQTPSGVHLAIEQLGPLGGGDDSELSCGLKFFLHHLGKSHYADEVQAFMSLFLQAHGEELQSSPELRGLCAEMSLVQEKMWNSLSTQCQKARCFLGMLTQTQSQW